MTTEKRTVVIMLDQYGERWCVYPARDGKAWGEAINSFDSRGAAGAWCEAMGWNYLVSE